jgi:hypothetical protein
MSVTRVTAAAAGGAAVSLTGSAVTLAVVATAVADRRGRQWRQWPWRRTGSDTEHCVTQLMYHNVIESVSVCQLSMWRSLRVSQNERRVVLSAVHHWASCCSDDQRYTSPFKVQAAHAGISIYMSECV